jgi:8-oxo-dGTP pyrophosphatase MutT (NUDIX family)
MLAVARRELAEEAGLIAAEWRNVGPVDVCNGIADDVQTFFLATRLTPTDRKLDPEEDIAVKWTPFAEAVAMAIDSRITDVCSVAALLRVNYLRNTGR